MTYRLALIIDNAVFIVVNNATVCFTKYWYCILQARNNFTWCNGGLITGNTLPSITHGFTIDHTKHFSIKGYWYFHLHYFPLAFIYDIDRRECLTWTWANKKTNVCLILITCSVRCASNKGGQHFDCSVLVAVLLQASFNLHLHSFLYL